MFMMYKICKTSYVKHMLTYIKKQEELVTFMENHDQNKVTMT